MQPLVTIVGRPNVGKSTLFNRLAGRRQALVHSVAGVTRDRLYAEVEIDGRQVRLADTGGLDLENADALIAAIREQALAAVNEADLLLLVVDVRAGLLPADRELAAHLRRAGRPLILVINKVDTERQAQLAAEFYELGLEPMLGISAEHGAGVSALKGKILEMLPERETEEEEGAEATKVAIIGRPNVGKSSLLNAIIGQGRMIVSEAAGTTRDVVDAAVTIDDRRFVFLDTAGIRKKAAIEARVEVVGSIKARQTIAAADCCILVLDAAQGLTSQDKALGGMIDRQGAAAIIAANKWDLLPGDAEGGKAGDRFLNELRAGFAALRYAPIVTTIALTGARLPRLVEKLVKIDTLRRRTIPPHELGSFLEALFARTPPPSDRGKPVEIFRIQQYSSAPAGFRLFVRGHLAEHYMRFMENELRAAFDFEGLPIRLAVNRC